MQQTLSIIKPDGVKRNLSGEILKRIEESGLRIKSCKMIQLSLNDAEKFYEVHKERPFFGELTEFMSSGPIVVIVLEGKNAVVDYRTLMGATNPAEADAGTIRKDLALSIGENTVHGSDSLENAKIEIDFFFAQRELVN